MPTLDQHQSLTTVKLLVIGTSGAGKTGALISLIKAGYKLIIADFDNGTDILANLVREQCPDKLKNVRTIPLTDKLRFLGPRIIPDGTPTAWQRFGELCSTGLKDTDGELVGPVTKLGPDTVFVVDSLTFAAQAAFRYVLASVNRSAAVPQIQDWGEAMRLTELYLAMMYSEAVKCHVIYNTHIEPGQDVLGATKAYPSALGTKLPPKVGRYFNTILLAETVDKVHLFRTETLGTIELKNPIPGVLPDTLPIQTGLATFFEAILKHGVAKAA